MAELDLTPEKALIFRITHVENVPWLLDNGLHASSADTQDRSFRRIGNPDLIAKRMHRPVPIHPGGRLGDYVPFYFTPCTPMLYNIKTGYQGVERVPMRDVAVLVSSLRRLGEQGVRFVFTDRHAYLQTAVFSNDLGDLAALDWASWRTRDFRRRPDDPSKIERYQAEALIHRHLPANGLIGLGCYGPGPLEALQAEIAQRGLDLRVLSRPEWYP